MEFLVVIDAFSAFGARMLVNLHKIGGATDTAQCGNVAHPVIVCRDLDWSVPGFMMCAHLGNPAGADQLPRHTAIQAQSVLFVLEVQDPAGTDAKQQPPKIGFH